MHIQCPHCRNPIELADVPEGDVLCPSCGFRLAEGPSTTTTLPGGRGVRIARFEVEKVLGTGAFGTVYQARHPDLDRIVALKVPRAGNVGLERFLREAKAAANRIHAQYPS